MGKAIIEYDKFNNFELIEIFKKEYERIQPIDCRGFYNSTVVAPSLYIIGKRLNMKWNDILKFIGVDEDKILFKRIDKEDCIRILQVLNKNLGKVPSAQDLMINGYKIHSFEKHFGSFNNALKFVGLIPRKTPVKVKESKQELLRQYIRLSQILGRPANYYDIEKTVWMYNPSVYTIRFGGMRGLKKAAGFNPYHIDNRKYTKDKVSRLLINNIIENKKVPSTKELLENENLPSYATILTHFNTTKISEVWKQLIDGKNLKGSYKLKK